MEAGEEVICLDNYFTGRKDNIAHWIGHHRFELIRHDVTEPIKLKQIVYGTWHVLHHQFTISLIRLRLLKPVFSEPTTC